MIDLAIVHAGFKGSFKSLRNRVKGSVAAGCETPGVAGYQIRCD